MRTVLAEIITIGDEILYGQTLDTNSHYISQKLDEIGIRVFHKSTVPDIYEEIQDALVKAEQRVDLIVITGGLGPTKDDITKKCLAEYFGSTLILNEEVLEDVTTFLAGRGREITPLNRLQAEVPDNCTVIRNNMGTAPAMLFERNTKVFISMPGVPHEMKNLVDNEVIPLLRTKYADAVIVHRMVKTTGIGESWLADLIQDWEEQLPDNIKLAYLPSPGEVKLRLTATGGSIEKLNQLIDEEVKKLNVVAGQYIYSMDNEELENIVGRLLKEKGMTLAIAESCTGGFASHLVTSIPGSSAYLIGSVVAYQNEVKTNLLGVPEPTIRQHGAVSKETVEAMARGVRVKLNTHFGLATSGIAGPDGGTPEKPVGTVWIACASEIKVVSRKLLLTNNRLLNIKRSAREVLNLLREQLMEI